MKRAGIEYKFGDEIASWQTKEAVDGFADRVRKHLQVSPGDDLIPTIDELGGQVRYLDIDSLSERQETIIVHGTNDFEIYLLSYTSPIRDRFTIAHELGHYYLHSRLGEIPIVANRHGSSRVEWEANWFAAGFLMPKTIIRREVESIESKTALAGIFGVSEVAVDVRLKSLGIKWPHD